MAKKYIDADRLKELLEAKYNEFIEKAKKDCPLQYKYMADGLDIAEQFLDSLQQEQPSEDLEEEIKRYIPREQCPVPDLMEAVARHFAEWQKEQDTREMIMSDGSYFQKCYELGKKDMKEQMGEQARKELAKTDITLADLVAFDEGLKLGRRLERQDMLKEAVEGEVCYGSEGAYIETDFLGEYDTGVYGHPGDKVKIVIIPDKEDEK